MLTQPWATVIGGGCVVTAGLLAFAVAYYNRRQAETHWRTTNRQERFSTIGTQLSDESAAVRIAGIYAMEALIDDWLKPPPIPLRWYIFKPCATWSKERRTATRRIHAQSGTRQAQACVNVLCAYLRLSPLKNRDSASATDDGTDREARIRPPDSHVRSSIIRTIAAHLKPEPPGESWSNLDYDFSEAQLHDANFFRATFASAAVFDRVQFAGEVTSFHQAQFLGKVTLFGGAQFLCDTTLFRGAQFRGGSISFHTAQFRGESISFEEAEFAASDGTSFHKAQFLSETSFEDPVAWSNMHFDWDWPLPDKKPGPAPIKPLTVKPDKWPPTLQTGSNATIGPPQKRGRDDH